jgi:hypothetical protein
VHWLPEPTVWHVPPPDLTPEQQQRKDEVDLFLADRYRDYQILEATQGYSGDIFYWVDPNTIPGAFLTPPPPTWTAEDLIPPAGAELARAELELYPELRGPAGTTPFPRPDYSMYIMGLTGATSLQDYRENYQVPGQPSGQNRLYAGLHSLVPNMGASGTINQFHGDVEQGSMTLIEVAVACPLLGPLVEQIGVAVTRDRTTSGTANDGKVRLRVEYTTNGGASVGDLIGGWDEKYAGFVPYYARPYGPGGEVPASLPGLGTQRENRIDIFQSAGGDWWIAHNGNLLGYYPANLFKQLNTGGCRAAWYGEVYDPTPTDWTWTDMGSGAPDLSAGYAYLAYVRNPMFRDYIYGPWHPGDCVLPECEAKPYDSKCYMRSPLLTYTSPWDYFFYLTGAGGDAMGCD